MKKPYGNKQKQLKIILELVAQVDLIINTVDPDEEGQLLVEKFIEHTQSDRPVKRVLINDNNTKFVQKALADLRDNADFADLSIAAEAGSVTNQLDSYNMTRAYTLSGYPISLAARLSSASASL